MSRLKNLIAKLTSGFHSLRWRLLVGNTLIFMVLLGLFSVAIFYSNYKIQERNIALHNEQLALQVKGDLEHAIAAPIQVMQELQKYLLLPHGENRTLILDSTLSTLTSVYPYISQVSVVDGSGKILQVYPEHPALVGTSVAYETFFQNKPIDQEVRWSEVYLSPENGTPALTASINLGELLLVADIDIQSIANLVATRKYNGLTDIMVLDKYGTYLVARDTHLVNQRRRHPEFDIIRNLNPVNRFVSHGNKNIQYTVFTTGWQNSWYLVLEENRRAIYAPLYQLMQLFFVAVTLIVIGTVVFIHLNVRRIIQDLGVLMGNTQSISNGNYMHPQMPRYFREIQDLGQSIIHMSEQIARREEEVKGLNYELEEMVTELECSNADLEEAVKHAEDASLSKTQFLANMSHEIRTPMNGMIGMMHLMADTPLSDLQKSYLTILQNSSEALLTILNAILDYSKVEAGVTEINSAPFEIDEMLRSLTRLFSANAKEKNIALNLTIPQGALGVLEVDGSHLRQVVSNLIGNAIKFTRRGSVHVSYLEGEIPDNPEFVTFEIAVRDSGVGISDAERTRLFQRFMQFEQPTGQKTQGTGLGLAISKMLIELMGGVITVVSIPGQGSTFTIKMRAKRVPAPDIEAIRLAHLPLQTPVPDPNLNPGETRKNFLEGRQILVVEDDTTSRFLLERILKQQKAHVITASDGQEALAIIEENHKTLDAVLMDVNMPHLDGLSATRILRENATRIPKYRDLIVIAMTAYAMPQDQERCLEAGMTDYLTKPVDVPKLLVVLQKYLQESHQPSNLLTDFKKDVTPMNTHNLNYIDVLKSFESASGLDQETCMMLLDIFFQQSDDMLVQIQTSFTKGDHESLRALLHRLKGTAGNVRANAIMEAALEAEVALKMGDIQSVESGIAQLETLLSQVRAQATSKAQ